MQYILHISFHACMRTMRCIYVFGFVRSDFCDEEVVCDTDSWYSNESKSSYKTIHTVCMYVYVWIYVCMRMHVSMFVLFFMSSKLLRSAGIYETLFACTYVRTLQCGQLKES